MTHGPACSTVIGCTSPFSSKTCVMPIFLPRIPVTAITLSPHHATLDSSHCRNLLGRATGFWSPLFPQRPLCLAPNFDPAYILRETRSRTYLPFQPALAPKAQLAA